MRSSYEDTCIACGGSLAFFGRRLGYTYAICTSCETILLTPIPSVEWLAKAYRDEYADANHIATDAGVSRAATRTLHAALVDALQRHGSPGPVLDYGAGWGGLVMQLTSAGFDVVGYDLSETMVTACQRNGLPMKLGGIDDVTEREFGALVLASVFEHLSEPSQWLRAARARLRTGGLLVTTQPTAPFARTVGDLARLRIRSIPLPGLHQIFCPPWHVALYSLAGMRRIVEDAGFELVEVTPAPQQREPGMIGWIQRALELVNRAGWAAFGLRWPFFTGHIFVFRRLP